jgi:hypothetical protein
LPGAFRFDLRGAACQEREQSTACDVVEKSLGDAGARVMARVAKGLRIAQKIKFAARFSPESFEEIRALAAKRKTSVGKQIRHLVEIGLEVEAVADLVEITSK